ncbi:MAG: GIY-YIG nuclease family protein [Candidatus Omnitrophica bacterium]|nr:GIY-YIG nuclease family protein [Candidatus Omnitrophota bacterium]MBU1870432.1 GIY-YIG nuclease family protein [Candidatus Omnitrophota bacterium]
MCYVYILENKEGRCYIGSTSNIETRLRRHNQNSVRSTKNKGPWELVYKAEFVSRSEARKREIQIKSYKNPEYLRRQLGINTTPSSSLV